ncbi:SDR family NAD(P)-dependent oxidoreductase [Shewanella xiamenensis]|uniref:SDR family NAD(P)-dependent oxidoreductase n=1 Tax=Shewanella TaxID=22 RepID=UPI00084993E1|nr:MULTISPECIES: SDR family oxidoreductase [Shewanella]MDH1314222.1 SDR family oxidoreductase [Shewanella xiamenensis]ODR83978.1 short-chain dehydrogenase [Shewanella xiamenensis]QQK59263.1 SDR family oxidoreductase [Shewanella sp. LC6]TPE56410.1 SDR family oxidoreductase [Shewanella sp. LC2]
MKHVIVTGGSKGLGLAIVKYLLSENYTVSTCSRQKNSAIDELLSQHSTFQWFQVEIGNAEQTAEFVREACAWANEAKLWGVINNAGIAKEGILATFPNIETDSLLQVNLHGAIYLAREALRIFLRQNSAGRIINISSIIGSRGYTGLAAYSASKAGLDGLTRALARENGRRNITVNSIAPGYLDTEMSSTLSDKKREQIIRRTPMHRLGHVDDITPLVGFLLSDGASFITGQTITIDGGITN